MSDEIDWQETVKPAEVKRGKGRPKKNGTALHPIVLFRWNAAIAIYQRERKAGKTDRAAKEIAIAEIKHHHPKWKISKTEIERGLALLQPNERMKAGEEVFASTVNENLTSGTVRFEVVKYKSLRKPNQLIFGKKSKKVY